MKSEHIPHLRPPYSDEVSNVLARMMPSNSQVEPLKLFRTFAKNLPFAAAMGPLGGFMLSRGRGGGAGYDLRTRELVINRVTALCGCEYEWGVHVASYARAAELDDEQIYSTVHGSPDDPCWSIPDRAVLTMVDQLCSGGRLKKETYNAVAEHFSEAVMIELFALAGWYHAISFVANGACTELEDWAPRFPEKTGLSCTDRTQSG